jgi:Asp/Glu/hydantoin racemase
MSVVTGGHTNYGFLVGIMMLETKFPRVPGDIGNALTFPFPVLYKVIPGLSPSRLIMGESPFPLEAFIETGQWLIREGAKTIVTSCGLLALYQKELAQSLNVPVFSSSLLQIPLAYAATGRRVGVLTADQSALGRRHFESVGASEVPVAVEGIRESYFWNVLTNDSPELDVSLAEQDVLQAGRRLVADWNDIGAVVLECTNFPPFAKSIQQALGLPVYDIVTLTYMAYETVCRKSYREDCHER